MKRYFYLLSFFALAALTKVNGQATNSGAESTTTAFGYKFNASTNWGGTGANTDPATYEWIDISATGTRVTGLGDDNVVGPVPLGLNFKFYWNTYDEVFVGSNGYIMFGNNALIAQGASGMPNIPTTDQKNNFIAGFLADLTFVDNSNGSPLPGAKVLYQTIGTKFIITYDSIQFWNNDPTVGDDQASGNTSFQIVLDSQTNNFQINYKNSEGPWFTGNTGILIQGMENVQDKGLRWRRKGAATVALPPAQSAVKVTYPTSSSFVFKDVRALAMFTNDNKGGVAFKNVPKSLRAYVKNAGTVKVTTPINARIIISDYQDNGIYNQTVVIDSLQQGEEKIVDFPQLLQPGDSAGRFKVTLTTSTSGDQFASNNSASTKLVVLDSTQGSVDLKFTSPYPGLIPDSDPGTFIDVQTSPNSGMVFDPPYQPMVISKIAIDIVWPNQAGYEQNNRPSIYDSLGRNFVQVYLGDGPGGTIGTLIDSFTISNRTDFETEVVGLEFDATNDTLLNTIIRHKKTIATPFSWFNGARIYAAATFLNGAARFAWNAPYSELYKPGFPASGRCLEVTGGIIGENRGKDSIDVSLGLIGDPLAVAVTPIVKLPTISVDQNIPNPASQSTSVSFTLPSAGNVQIVVRDATGREVYTQSVNGRKGKQSAKLSLQGLKPAMYFYTVSHSAGTVTKKLIVE